MEIVNYFALIVLLSGVAFGQTGGPTPTPSDEFDCPNNEDGFYPHPSDCSKYFACTNGLAWEESCPAGLLFNPVTLQCDWPDLVNCNSSVPTTPRPTNATTLPSTNATLPVNGTTTTAPPTNATTPVNGTTFTPHTTRPITNSTTPISNSTTPVTDLPTTPSPGGEFQCPSADGTFAHPEDCTKYYVCVDNVSIEESCPDGLWFDPTLLICNWPEVVQCDSA